MRVAVLTAIYGGYDFPKWPVDQTIDADWILVSDEPLQETGPWRVIHEPRPDVHRRLAAKRPKCVPGEYADADVYVWIDANNHITAPDFLEHYIAALDDADFVLFQHPGRTDIFSEAEACDDAPSYIGQPLHEQVEHYRTYGADACEHLWWGGLIVRRGPQADFGRTWMAEQERWSVQDQLSLPYALWTTNKSVVSVGESIVWNDRFQIYNHLLNN